MYQCIFLLCICALITLSMLIYPFFNKVIITGSRFYFNFLKNILEQTLLFLYWCPIIHSHFISSIDLPSYLVLFFFIRLKRNWHWISWPKLKKRMKWCEEKLLETFLRSRLSHLAYPEVWWLEYVIFFCSKLWKCSLKPIKCFMSKIKQNTCHVNAWTVVKDSWVMQCSESNAMISESEI